MKLDANWLSRAEVYGEAIRNWTQLSRYRFDLVTHVPPGRDWMKRLRSIGSMPIPYITMYQQPMYSTYQGIDLRRHTDWIELDQSGNWKRTSFWDTEDQKNWYVTCPNVQGYVDAVLEHVASLMEAGAGGIFVDNVGGRKKCFGPEFGAHQHIFDDQVKAFSALLGSVKEVIKEHDPNGVLLVNSASPDTLPDDYWIYADADMAESYICTWVSDERWMDWHQHWNAIGRKVAGWMEKGRTVLALSYLGHTANSIKDDAFFCYCSARLSGFLWSAGGDILRGDPAEVLYSIRLGQPIGKEEETGGIHHRKFERGLVVVNPEEKAEELEIQGRPGHRLWDLYEDSPLGSIGENTLVKVPSNSGRVYLYLPEYVVQDTEPHRLMISTSPPLGNVKFLIDGIENYTKSGCWKIAYDKGEAYGTLVSRYEIPGTHVIEAADLRAKDLEISKGYGSVEKLAKPMDPAEPTKPAGGPGYVFQEWGQNDEVMGNRRIEVIVEGETNLLAVYSTEKE